MVILYKLNNGACTILLGIPCSTNSTEIWKSAILESHNNERRSISKHYFEEFNLFTLGWVDSKSNDWGAPLRNKVYNNKLGKS